MKYQNGTLQTICTQLRSNILILPAGAAFVGFATASSSSLLDSSLLELSALGLAFLAEGPLVLSVGAFLFLESGDLVRHREPLNGKSILMKNPPNS